MITRKTKAPTTASAARQRNLLTNLSKHDRDLLFSKCTKISFKRGDFLFLQGTRHAANFLITSGLVRSFYISPLGREMTLTYQSTGDLVGGPDFLDEHAEHIWSAQAADHTTAYMIGGKDFGDIAAQVPAIARTVIYALSHKLRWESILLQTLSTGSVDVRLAYLLLKLSETFGEDRPEGTVIDRHFSHADLASMVGATRQWVSTTLGSFRRKGVVRIGKRRLVIVDKTFLLNAIHKQARSLGKVDA